jgi:hypothetical protein
MKLRELKEHLEGLDPEMEVQIRIYTPDVEEDEMPLSEFIGEYCEVTDERNVSVEYGKLTIIGDWNPE